MTSPSLPQIDKSELLDNLRARIESDLADQMRRQQDVQEGATHEESRSEHAKDTRATEQSYLARGLAQRVEELTRTRDALLALKLREFAEDEAIAVCALVTLQDEADPEGESQLIWLVPGAGALDLRQQGHTIRTVTPVSPLGRALIGLHIGDEGRLKTPRAERNFEVIDVQ
ncbi:MAG: GreA/GreB family elongation factor [Myxococcota bacterium]